jgi:3-oxoacyl-[acyl-carrier protein] reductase
MLACLLVHVLPRNPDVTAALSGKVAIVTGGSKGIGRACAVLLARRGASVVVNYANDEAAAQESIDLILAAGGRAVLARARVESPNESATLFRTAQEHFGRADILICNAGVSSLSPLASLSEAEYHRIYDINVKALLFLLKEAATGLNDNGRIVTISSSTAVNPRAAMALYASSKAAVRTITEVAAAEFGPRGITVNCILPGLVDTPMIKDLPGAYRTAAAASSPFGRIGKPEDIAAVVGFLASKEAAWVTGQSIIANGGATR